MTIQPSHEELVQEVCAQVKEGEGNLLTVYKPHVSHTPRTVDYKRGCFPVDVSRLNRILEINTQEGWVIAEGNVTLDQLVTATLEFGMIPPVVPELRNFTVAGLINGRGLQSSSHKHCMFEWKGNIPEMEVVIGDGSVIVCNDKNHTDLFWHIKGCYGTLGFVTKAKIRLIPATKTVKSEYHVFDKIGEFVSFMESQLEKPQYLDGVVFAKDHAVAIVSDFVDRVPKGEEDLVFHPLYPESPGGEYYYQYVKNRTKDKKTFMDYIPTKEFVHRSERGLWWMTEAMVNDEQLCSLAPFRAFLDTETKKQYKNHGFNDVVLTKDELKKTMVGQDQGFKMSRIEERINWAIENIGVFPIWLCYIWLPLERRNDGKWKGESHIADLGLYGFPPSSSYRCQRDLRAWQLSADAPAAWGDLYMTLEEAGRKDEFGPAYQALRKKYKADGAFKRIEDKIAFYDPNEPDLGGPMPFFRIRRTWRYSKAKFLVMALIVPFIKLGFLTASILDLLLLPVRLVFPKSDSKKLKVD